MELDNVYVESSLLNGSKFGVDLESTSVEFPEEHVAVEACRSCIGVESIAGGIRVGVEPFRYLRHYVIVKVLIIVVEYKVCVSVLSEETLIKTVEASEHVSDEKIS